MKNIIFDLGNVLIEWDCYLPYRSYFNNDLSKIEKFFAETRILEVNHKMDEGYSYAEVLTELSKKFPHHHEAIYFWKDRWPEMVIGPIEASVNILKSLENQGYPVYAITNWSTETFFPYIWNNPTYSFLNIFKDIAISGVEKVAKPDSRLFEILLKRNSLDPKSCVFIDDSKKNLLPAKELGMEVIHFNSPEQLQKDLAQLGVEVQV